jgi:hypothetical protein
LLLSLTSAMADRRAVTLVVFLALNTLWDMAFGPIYSSLPYLAPALGLLLLPRNLSARETPRDEPLRLGDEAGASSHP